MRYKGQEVETPTLEMFKEYIEKKNMAVDPQKVYNYCVKNNWLTKKGTPMVSVESVTNAINGVYTENQPHQEQHNYSLVSSNNGVFDIVLLLKQKLGKRCPDDSTLNTIIEETSNFLYGRINRAIATIIIGKSN